MLNAIIVHQICDRTRCDHMYYNFTRQYVRCDKSVVNRASMPVSPAAVDIELNDGSPRLKTSARLPSEDLPLPVFLPAVTENPFCISSTPFLLRSTQLVKLLQLRSQIAALFFNYYGIKTSQRSKFHRQR